MRWFSTAKRRLEESTDVTKRSFLWPEQIGRTASSVSLKMANFASLDPTLERAGMGNYSKLDAEIWSEFFENTQNFLEEASKTVERFVPNSYLQPDLAPIGFRDGGEYEVKAKARKNQSFFREMILASYNYKCAVTGIDVPQLLTASHIIPWAEREDIRTDPRNGICLNALHDRAFDRGLISFDDNFRMILSKQIRKSMFSFFKDYEGKQLTLPDRFVPSIDFLRSHRESRDWW